MDGGQGIVAEQAVLDGQNRAHGLGVLEEKRIVPDAKPQEHVKLRTHLIDDHGLEHRVAHGFPVGAGIDLVLGFDAEHGLGLAADLAADRGDLKAVGDQNLMNDGRFLAEDPRKKTRPKRW